MIRSGLDTGRLRIETAVVMGIMGMMDIMMLLLDDAGERQAARFNAMQSAMRSHFESGLGNTDRCRETSTISWMKCAATRA